MIYGSATGSPKIPLIGNRVGEKGSFATMIRMTLDLGQPA